MSVNKNSVAFAATQKSVATSNAESILSGNKWVNYGEGNNFPLYLWDLYLNSSVHQAIIDGTKDYVLGEGIESQHISQDLVDKITLDYVLYGGFAVEVVYNLIGEIAKLTHLDFANCRTNKEIDTIYYSKDWKKWSKSFVEYPVFNPSAPVKKSQVLWVQGNRTRGIYPIPRYIGGLSAVETSIEIQNYHLSAIKNNFVVSAIINFNNGQPTEDEKALIEKGIKEKFTGSDNASTFMLAFNESKESAVTTERLEGDKADEKFLQLSKDTKENIFISHRVTSGALFGLVSESTGFNATEYVQSFNIYNKTVIQPMQKDIAKYLYPLYNELIIFKPFVLPVVETAQALSSDEQIGWKPFSIPQNNKL
jgi:capsid portal protein